MVAPSLLRRVIESHGRDIEIMSIRDHVLSDIGDELSDIGDEGWAIHTYGSLRYRGWVVVPQSEDLKEEILKEFHCSHFSIYPIHTKMYHDLPHQYYWSGMKKHVGEFVHRCLTCQQVKVEHQRPARLLQSLEVAE